MNNQDIARIFYSIAEILEIQGENPFKIRAYIKAAQTVESYTKELSEIKDTEELKDLPGIGEKIALKIKELLETGKLEMYEKLKKSEFAPLVELLEVPGMGPKHVRLVYDELGIKTLDQLEKAARRGKLKELPGLGEKTEQNILKGIEQERRHKERYPIGEILPKAESVISQLQKAREVKDISLGGSLRRMKETIGDVDILVSSLKPKAVSDAFVKLTEVQNILSQGPTKSSIVTKDGIQMDLRVVKPESYGAAQHYFTGSKAHNIRIRSLGIDRGLKVNEYGVFKGKKSVAGKTEEEVFKSVGLTYIPPEMREDWGEIEAAQKKKLPHLIELKDIQGDLHIHSNWTDGRSTIEEMAKAAQKIGYQYIALCDHSPTIGVTNGLTPERLEKRKKEIDRLNRKFKNFKILNGIEVDIKPDGKTDLDDEILKKLDIVVGAVHTRFSLPKEEMTRRIIKAIENPCVHIIAHPTGRLLGKRDPYEVDMDKLLDAARANQKIMELNAFPARLDLNDLHCRKAKEKGVKVVISTDAHWTEHLHWIKYGIATARRGWLEPEDVVNTLSLEKLLKYLK
ncbi:MAG: DNA polymerase/3'-5' exonuclease PolX [candidate division Zixibacteria bacterium]|nr:DNA polymerase/3'-5' exonuclease PolX [candidate division Zixibacteria bacterium]